MMAPDSNAATKRYCKEIRAQRATPVRTCETRVIRWVARTGLAHHNQLHKHESVGTTRLTSLWVCIL